MGLNNMQMKRLGEIIRRRAEWLLLDSATRKGVPASWDDVGGLLLFVALLQIDADVMGVAQKLIGAYANDADERIERLVAENVELEDRIGELVMAMVTSGHEWMLPDRERRILESLEEGKEGEVKQ